MAVASPEQFVLFTFRINPVELQRKIYCRLFGKTVYLWCKCWICVVQEICWNLFEQITKVFGLSSLLDNKSKTWQTLHSTIREELGNIRRFCFLQTKNIYQVSCSLNPPEYHKALYKGCIACYVIDRDYRPCIAISESNNESNISVVWNFYVTLLKF